MRKELGNGTLAIRKKKLSDRVICTIVLLILAILSATVMSSFASSTDFHAATFATLDKQKENASLLLVSISATSAVISMIPDDACTSIAEELSNLSSYFLLALSVLYTEKFLLTTIGYVVFTWIVPISLLLIILYLFRPKLRQMFNIAVRVLAFGLALYFVIPLSALICDNVQETYQATIQETIDSAIQSEDVVKDDVQETEEEEKGYWNSLDGNKSGVADALTGSLSDTLEQAKTVLDNYIEAVAVMLVTSCVIPLVVLLCLLKAAKALFNISFSIQSAHADRYEKLPEGQPQEN